ncbi:phage minor capsid protein [Gemmiger sp.]|uniref:phage minor capsid protein n=1 Tax=Gemmiger sp. TaxID=2049027 RepID=UPI0025C36DD5|nr:phage minor capsid protein [Gemmiger sp.]
MLTPDQLEALPRRFVQLWQQVEDDILQDIARRIKTLDELDPLPPTAIWQAWRLAETRAVRSSAVATLAKYTSKSRAEIKRLLEAAGAQTLAADDAVYTAAGLDPPPVNQSPALLNLLNAGYRQTCGTWQNLTATTANTVTGTFEDRLSRAWGLVSTGALDYSTAIRRTVDDLADTMPYITYPSGHTDTLEVAARRAVLTGVNQTCAKLQLARMEEMDCEFVEVTAHEGARPTHAVWQGRVYHRGGAVVQDGERYEDFETATGYGTGPGLCGWNCRHNFYPFYPGFSVRNYTDERLAELDARNIPYGGGLYTRYEITQMQRALERRVRKYKRRYLAETAAGVDAGQSAAKLKAARQQLSAFLAETGERVDGARAEVPGFGQRDAKQADEAASALQSVQNNATLKEISLGYKEITIQSIQRIQPFACETLDAAGSRALANAHKKLLLEARKVPLGIEKARCYGLDMQPLGGYKESSEPGTSVKIKVPNVDCIVMHSHPSGLTFSPDDLDAFSKNKTIRILTAVGNDGSLYAIERTNNTDETALENLTSLLMFDMNKATTKAAVYDTLNTYFKEVQNYGIHYYAREN